MSVVSVTELHQRRRSSWDNGIKHTRAFQVVCDDARDGTRTAIVAASPSYFTLDNPTFANLSDADFNNLVANSTLTIPIPNSPFPYDTQCRVSSISAEPVDGSDVVFEVTVEYVRATLDELPVHPLERPAKFSYTAAEYTEPWFLDESQPTRKPYVNTAYEPFENTSDRDNADLIINMVRNEAYFDVLEADDLKNSTNQGIVFLDGQGYAPDCLRMSMPTATKESEEYLGETVDYYSVSRQFKAKRSGWTEEVLSYGYNELVMRPGPSGAMVPTRMPIMDAAATKTTRPWPLDADGHALPSPSGAPAVCEFRPYRAADWSSMALA